MNLTLTLTLPLQHSKTNFRKAIFPGSFDPFHDGHYQILLKANQVFDEVIVLVANNCCKSNSPLNQRIKQVKEYLVKHNLSNEVIYTDGLTTDIAAEYNCKHLIRGIRNSEDFTYELELANKYKKLSKEIEVVFFFAENEYTNFRSSKLRKLF